MFWWKLVWRKKRWVILKSASILSRPRFRQFDISRFKFKSVTKELKSAFWNTWSDLDRPKIDLKMNHELITACPRQMHSDVWNNTRQELKVVSITITIHEHIAKIKFVKKINPEGENISISIFPGNFLRNSIFWWSATGVARRERFLNRCLLYVWWF